MQINEKYAEEKFKKITGVKDEVFQGFREVSKRAREKNHAMKGTRRQLLNFVSVADMMRPVALDPDMFERDLLWIEREKDNEQIEIKKTPLHLRLNSSDTGELELIDVPPFFFRSFKISPPESVQHKC